MLGERPVSPAMKPRSGAFQPVGKVHDLTPYAVPVDVDQGDFLGHAGLQERVDVRRPHCPAPMTTTLRSRPSLRTRLTCDYCLLIQARARPKPQP